MNYPNKSKKEKVVLKTSASKRGMTLEEDINNTNAYYRENDIAFIYKKPTPITLVHVDYPSRSAAKITEAYFNEPSTTDYNGIYKEKYIDFEAKECHSKTSFPFSSIHVHQIKHLENVLRHGAIAFIIIRMTYYDETYLLFAKDFLEYYNNTSRKSLPYEWIKENSYKISYNYIRPVDYLKIIDRYCL